MEEQDRNEKEKVTVGKLLPVGKMIPSLDLADCDAQVLSQHPKGIKGLKFSIVTTDSSPDFSNHVGLAAKLPPQFESGL